MQEVIVKIRFTTPCLAGVRNEKIDTFLRDTDGNIIFLSSWWRALLTYAAKATNVLPSLVSEIKLDPVVSGLVVEYKRFYDSTESFKLHESFSMEHPVTVKAMLPDGLELDTFKELLRVGGSYVGLSPYGYDRGYGRFTVIEIKPKNAEI